MGAQYAASMVGLKWSIGKMKCSFPKSYKLVLRECLMITLDTTDVTRIARSTAGKWSLSA